MKTITVPIGRANESHLEFEVVPGRAGTYTVIDECGGFRIMYVGFPNRKEAEKFVLAQPESWN